MNDCPRCGQRYDGLACRACASLQSRQAVWETQGSRLARARKGGHLFYVKRLSIQHPWHVMLFGDKAHGFCDCEIKAAGPNNRRELAYAELGRSDLCSQCLDKMRAIEEAEAIREES